MSSYPVAASWAMSSQLALFEGAAYQGHGQQEGQVTCCGHKAVMLLDPYEEGVAPTACASAVTSETRPSAPGGWG